MASSIGAAQTCLEYTFSSHQPWLLLSGRPDIPCINIFEPSLAMASSIGAAQNASDTHLRVVISHGFQYRSGPRHSLNLHFRVVVGDGF